jgi:hypothetical protein
MLLRYDHDQISDRNYETEHFTLLSHLKTCLRMALIFAASTLAQEIPTPTLLTAPGRQMSPLTLALRAWLLHKSPWITSMNEILQ